MILLPGIGAVVRPAALGVAARVAWQHGRPTLTEETLGWLEERVRREEGPIQLILVVDSVEPALWMPLPFDAVLAGIVAERSFAAPPGDVVPVPVVCAVEEARASIGEGTLLLVDPHRACVCVEPSAEEVLAVERRRRRRVLLGPAHTPATTRTGVTIPVWGSVSTAAERDEAVRGGADGLFITGFQEIGMVENCARAMGGGPVAAPLSPAQAFALSRDADVVQWTPTPEDATRWNAALAESIPGTPAPKRVGLLRPEDDPGTIDPTLDGLLADAELLPLPVLDLPPLWVRVDDPADVPAAIAGGAHLLVVPASMVAATKDAVRSTD
ncbi:MAG: hypothetical protein ACKO5K_05520 [Armatimonadota bacterium]